MTDSKSSANTHSLVLRLGFWAAIFATVAVIIAGITAKMASGNSSLIFGFILIPLMMVLMVVIHDYAPPERKFFSRLGLLFTAGYAVLVSLNYFILLTVSEQAQYAVAFATDDPKSLTGIIGSLGYGFLGMATLFAAFVFTTGWMENTVRWLFIINAILGLGEIISFGLDWPKEASLATFIVWHVIMPASTILLAILFKRRAAANTKSLVSTRPLVGH